MARKSPTITLNKTCKNCGKTFLPRGNRTFYCDNCRPLMEKRRKVNHYIKTNPNAYKPKVKQPPCCVCGKPFASSYKEQPYCNKHYLRMYTRGTPNKRERKSKNTYEIKENYVVLKTTKGEEFLIDQQDLDFVLTRTWCVSKTGYLVASLDKKTIKCHRYLLGLTDPKVIVDHINHNPLDNRRSNLRVCSQNENGKNQKKKKNNVSGYSGIRVVGIKEQKYVSRIIVNSKEIIVGRFSSFDEAVKARKEAELKYYGEFAPHL